MTTILILFTLIWFISGACGFIFWWTKDFDLDSSMILKVILLSSVGPFTWIIGYSIHGNKKEPKILIKKRK